MCRHAIRRVSSNSTTGFVIPYGMPSRMDMPNFEPSSSRAGSSPRACFTMPDPSITGCCDGSASTSKIFSGGASITRSTETDFTCSVTPSPDAVASSGSAAPVGKAAGAAAEGTVTGVDPVEALEETATLLERGRAATYKVQAFRRAADTVRELPPEKLQSLATQGRLQDLPGVGSSTAGVIEQALAGGVHEYMALTDHSPSLKVANGLTADRLRQQLELVAELNDQLAPFRILTGIEVDILEDGTLDQDEDLLAELDVVVASVHSKLRMPAQPMTDRMVAALASPHTDILGHCTGRMVLGRGRPESQFDSQLVFGVAAHFDKAVEINCRPERLDPPMRLLQEVVGAGCKVSIDSDAHAPGQLEWQPYGCARAAEATVPLERIVNTWERDDLLAWTASHEAA